MMHLFFPLFCFGAVGVFFGSVIYSRLCRRQGGLTNFQRFLFGTGFVYTLFVLSEMVRFFVDYYDPHADLQHSRFVPGQDFWFFRLFGQPAEGPDRTPILATDLRIFFLLFGALAGGAALLLLAEVRSRKRKDGNALLEGYVFPRTSLRGYFAGEFASLKRELPLLEYLSWWILRGLMLWAILRKYAREGFTMPVMLLVVNTAVTFVIPLVRLLFFSKLFFGRIPFRVQTYINVFVFSGSFLFHGLDLPLQDYDKYLHVISGGLAVFIGWTLIGVTRGAKRLPVGVRAAASGSFSCVVIVVWELFEFFTDHFIPGSNNQNLLYEPAPDMLFFRIFGPGAGNPTMQGVLDTDFDVFFAAVASLVCTLGLWIFLRVSPKLRRRGAARKTQSVASDPHCVEALQ